MTSKKEWLRKLEAFWFPQLPATELAACRILFFGWMFAFYSFRQMSDWAILDPAFYSGRWIFDLWVWTQPSHATARILEGIWLISLLTSAMGLLARTSHLTAFVLGAYFFGCRQAVFFFGKAEYVLVLILFVFVFAPSGDALSLDRRIQQRSGKIKPARESGWAVQLIRTLFVMPFFYAAIAKIRISGWGWAEGSNLQLTLIRERLLGTADLSPGLILKLENYPLICGALGIGTLALELIAPLALVTPRLRLWIMGALLSFQLGVLFTFGWTFYPYLGVYLLFLPWGAWINKWAPALSTSAQALGGKKAEAPQPAPHTVS